MTVEKTKAIIKGLKTKCAIIKALDEKNISYIVDNYTDYMNIKIHTESGCIRIYKSYSGKIEVQEMKKVIFEYSGTPVFFGSI